MRAHPRIWAVTQAPAPAAEDALPFVYLLLNVRRGDVPVIAAAALCAGFHAPQAVITGAEKFDAHNASLHANDGYTETDLANGPVSMR